VVQGELDDLVEAQRPEPVDALRDDLGQRGTARRGRRAGAAP
jgi:hypothetical protein